jgi:hypothetical protein
MLCLHKPQQVYKLNRFTATAITAIELEGTRLKNVFLSNLQQYIQSNNSFNQTSINQIHINAVAFFNHYEEFVGKSDILDVWTKDLWAMSFYETCFNLLETLTKYYTFMKTTCDRNNIDYNIFLPSKYAYQSLERVVFNFLTDRPDDIEKLKIIMEQLELPVGGFTKMKVKSLSITEKKTAIIFGGVLIIAIFCCAIFIPDPTSFQYVIFRMIMPLGFACIGFIIPGFIVIEGKMKSFSIRAGGALALFVLTYFFNPATLS